MNMNTLAEDPRILSSLLNQCSIEAANHLSRAKKAEEKCEQLRQALDKLSVGVSEMYRDWKKGDFELPKLAQCDLESAASSLLDGTVESALKA
jgi:hypothetical protein